VASHALLAPLHVFELLSVGELQQSIDTGDLCRLISVPERGPVQQIGVADLGHDNKEGVYALHV
jgi:hypothetical protein